MSVPHTLILIAVVVAEGRALLWLSGERRPKLPNPKTSSDQEKPHPPDKREADLISSPASTRPDLPSPQWPRKLGSHWSGARTKHFGRLVTVDSAVPDGDATAPVAAGSSRCQGFRPGSTHLQPLLPATGLRRRFVRI